MFLYKPGGEKRIVGQGYPCYLPPIPDKHLIIGYNKPREQQFWQRIQLPANYQERAVQEARLREREEKLVEVGKMKKVAHVDPVLERFRRMMWYYRIYGCWFMNDGEPTYLTNHHFFYLQCCKYDHRENDGYPMYYEFSRDNFYIRQWCEGNPRSLGYLMIAARGTGKCLGKGTKVMMYAGGFKNVEDVVAGDQLMGPDSTPRNVLSVASGKDDLYEVVQNRGIPYVVNSHHILSLRRNKGRLVTNNRNRKTQAPIYPSYGMVANVPIKEFIAKSQRFKQVFSGYKVGIEYQRRKIKLDPYFLGLWLGDGSAQYPRITNIDQPIIGWLREFAKDEGLNLVRVAESPINPLVASYTLSSPGARSSKNHLLDTMRDYDLINNKHIPEAYLYNNRATRLKLLAGLVDTDGNFSKGRYDITQVRKPLADQIMILVNGLGFRASMKVKIVNGVPYYRVGFSGKIDIPVLLDRKKNRGKPNKDNLLTRIEEINPLGRGEYFGFEIDGDHLFMLEDGTVTHNTNEEIARAVNRATYLHNHRIAYQGKHIDDSTLTMIQAKTVPLFNNLYSFFKPEYSHGTGAKSELIFTRPSTSGKNVGDIQFGPDYELNSTIFAVQPGEKVLDRETLGDAVVTEIGKTKPSVADVHVRHGVTLKTVYRNHRKIGMIAEESTVEEMDEGGDECHKIYKESDPRILDANGWTRSKIHRHFISALDTNTSLEKIITTGGQHYDAPCNKFGKVDRRIAGIVIQNDLDSVKHDLRELSSRMRKSPRTETEAFIKDQSKSLFNIMLLSDRIETIRNRMPKKPYVRGNLYWLKEKFGPVWWKRDDHAGRFNCAWLPDEFSQLKDPTKVKILNNVTKEWGYDVKGKYRELITPHNINMFRLGTDPIKYSKTKDPRASKAAIHAFRMYDPAIDHGKPINQWKSHNFFFEYCNRPEEQDTYLEDLAMLCIFLGAQVFPERNIPDVNAFFERNGLQRLLAYPMDFVEDIGLEVQNDSVEAGASTTKEVIHSYSSKLIPFINHHAHRMPFDETCEDWSNFDPLDPTKSHLTVSAGYTLIHSEMVNKNAGLPLVGKLSDYFDTFDNSGEVGTYENQSSDAIPFR